MPARASKFAAVALAPGGLLLWLCLGTLPAAQGQGPPARLVATQPETVRMPPLEQTKVLSPAASPPLEYRLEDLEELAQQYNPTLSQALWAVDNARGYMRQVGLYPNPTVGYLRSDPSKPYDAQKQGGLYSQTIVTGGKLRLNRLAEAEEVNARCWEYEAQRMRVTNDLRLRYYELLAAQQSLDVARELQKIAEEGLRLARQALEGKIGTRPDLLQARIQLNEVRIALKDAENRYAASWQQVAAIVGAPDLTAGRVAGSLKSDGQPLDFETSWQRLASASPQIFVAQARADHARALLRRALVEPLPDVTVQLIGERDYTIRSSSLSTLVAIPLPIYNRNQGNIQSARAELQEAQYEVERVQLALRDQLAITFRRYNTARSQAQLFEAEVLPDAKENLNLTNLGYKAGEFGLLNVLIARQTYFHANLSYIDSLAELRKTQIEIDGLLLTGGGLNPAAIGAAIQTTTVGGRLRVQGLLNESQKGASRQFLPVAGQVGGN